MRDVHFIFISLQDYHNQDNCEQQWKFKSDQSAFVRYNLNMPARNGSFPRAMGPVKRPININLSSTIHFLECGTICNNCPIGTYGRNCMHSTLRMKHQFLFIGNLQDHSVPKVTKVKVQKFRL